MDATRWARVQEIFLEVAELPPGAREERSREACGDDAALAEEVHSLLRFETEGGTLLDASLDDLALLLDGSEEMPEEPAAPTRIGPYRVLDPLGRGGMGLVYRAERDDGKYERTVALKLIRGGANDPDARARFHREQRILASLEHPGIARLYDAGVSDDGLPWLAMELVDGQPIHRFCDARGLGIAERLRLFEDVCEAVEFAHRSLVIHRDLKPSNILVTDEGRVKLLDFGIARLVEAEDGSSTGGRAGEDDPLTRVGQRVLTPGYSSPEQLRGNRLTTASDVYTLGVVLHRLLTGVVPEAPTDTVTEVTRPSAVVGSAPEDWPGWAPTDQVKRDLRGDLDTLLMKALRADPAERYASVAELREDLVRWRERRPLAARPPTMGYRASRFVRRNRGAVGAGAVLAVVLVVAAGLLVRAERRTAEEAARAEVEAAVANEVAEFLVELLSSAGPEISNGTDVPVRTVVDSAAVRLRSDLEGAPEVRARLIAAIADVYNQFGAYEDAASLVRLGTSVADDPVVSPRARAEVDLVGAYVAESTADYPRAVELADRARRTLEDDDSDAAPRLRSLAWRSMGLAYANAGDFDAAVRALRSAAAIDSTLVVRDDGAMLGQSLSILGQVAGATGDVENSIAWLEAAIENTARAFGEDHLRVHEIQIALGTTLVNVGRNEEAEVWSERALEGYLRLLGPEHPTTATAQVLRSLVLSRLGRLDEARPLSEAALATQLRMQGPDHPDVAYAHNTVATLAQESGDLAEAYENYSEAHRIFLAVVGPNNAATASMISRMGRVSLAMGDSTTAASELEIGLDGFYNGVGPEPATAGRIRTELVTLLEALGRTTEAERILRDYPIDDPAASEGAGG